MQNFFVINRFKHIESEESVGSIIYRQDMLFVVFVRVSDSKNTAQREAHLEQWVRIGLVSLEIIAFYSGHIIIKISASTTGDSIEGVTEGEMWKQSSVWRFATISADVSINSSLLDAGVTKSSHRGVISSQEDFYQGRLCILRVIFKKGSYRPLGGLLTTRN